MWTIKRVRRRILRILPVIAILAALFGSGCTAADQSVTATDEPAITYAEGGVNEGFAETFASGPKSGFWAGNVETVPERPAALPESFYQKPSQPPKGYPDEVYWGAGRIRLRAPSSVPDPLWVFADELDKQRLDEIVAEAIAEGRVVVVYARRYFSLVGTVGPPNPFDEPTMRSYGMTLTWAPWNESSPRMGSPYWSTPPEAGEPTRDAVYALMAMETVAEEVDDE